MSALRHRTEPDLEHYLDRWVTLLHERHIPGSRRPLDRVAIAPSGVWVIDAVEARGRVAVAKPGLGRPLLSIGGEDRSELVHELAARVGLVCCAMAQIDPELNVHGALCLSGGELPWIGRLTCNGYPLLHPRSLARQIARGGATPWERLQGTTLALSLAFPALA